MTDQELADHVMLSITGYRDIDILEPEQFVRDWRVAGALIEKCKVVSIAETTTNGLYVHARAGSNSNGYGEEPSGQGAKAVITACIDAITGVQTGLNDE